MSTRRVFNWISSFRVHFHVLRALACLFSLLFSVGLINGSKTHELSQNAQKTLRLNADLVVLSACQTGLGKDVRGEGLIGLVRGFMYAGAPRVMASMWEVDDAATTELMKRFYKGVLQEKLTPAAALRAAQIEMLKKSHWQSPYYWGAFVLQGEWR
jgi:CHAT domain-containing protein